MVRLRTGLRVLRRGAVDVQIGTDPRWAVLLAAHDRAEADLLCRLAADPDLDRLVARAPAVGVRSHRAHALVDALRAAHLTTDAPERSAPFVRACAAAEAATWSLLRPDGNGDAQVRARQARTVGVVGLGRLGLTTAVTLAAAGVGQILLDDAGIVTSADVGAAGYRIGDVGSARLRAASRILRDVAPDIRTEPFAQASPDVVVVVERDAAHPTTGLAFTSTGTAHLSVVVREADALVGPFVTPGARPGACLRCLDLRRSDADPQWPNVLAQLVGGPHAATPVACEVGVLAGVCGALAAAEILAHLDGRTPRTRGATYEVALPDVLPRLRTWAAHPDCGCTALPTGDTVDDPGNAP